MPGELDRYCCQACLHPCRQLWALFIGTEKQQKLQREHGNAVNIRAILRVTEHAGSLVTVCHIRDWTHLHNIIKLTLGRDIKDHQFDVLPIDPAREARFVECVEKDGVRGSLGSSGLL